MIVTLFRILILIALILIIYTICQFLRNPERKLRIAKKSNQFYIVDDPKNSKRNIQIVYKGCHFEGEKYLGTTDQAFEVVDIHVTITEPGELRGITRDDLYFLEKEILIRYPYAEIKWNHPINQLMIISKE